MRRRGLGVRTVRVPAVPGLAAEAARLDEAALGEGGVNFGLRKKDSHTERVTASLTSWPIRSVSWNGPILKPPLSRSTASMVAGSAPCSSYTAKASA